MAAAYRRLEDHILVRSTAVTSWSGSIPPEAVGWLPGWTARGVRARYCADTLLVYLEPAHLKVLGKDHRAVHAAPHSYVGGGLRGQLAPLHWLEGGVAQGSLGRASVALPDCLSAAARGGALPSGRAALGGMVKDPFVHTRARVTRERQVEACGSGYHGDGKTMVREVSQEYDGRGNKVGTPVDGAWKVLVDQCRADYTAWQRYTVDCSWVAGPPHNKTMHGREIWRRRKTVTAAGVSLDPPEFVSTSCWSGAAPAAAVATVTESTSTETEDTLCPEGTTGSATHSRTVTTRSTTWPWDDAPTVVPTYLNWIVDESGCSEPGGSSGGEGGGGGDDDGEDNQDQPDQDQGQDVGDTEG